MSLDPEHLVDLVNGRFAGTTADDLDSLFAGLAASPHKDRLVVHFHGGLVNHASGLAIGERLLPRYQGAGGYPVFFVWHAGLLEVLSANLGAIVQERIFRRLRDIVTQLAIGKSRSDAGGRGGALELPPLRNVQQALSPVAGVLPDDPFADEAAILRSGEPALTADQETLVLEQLGSDLILNEEAAAIAGTAAGTRSAGAAQAVPTLMDAEVLTEMREGATPGTRGLISTAVVAKRALGALKQVLARFAANRDHGLYPTVVEELLRAFYLGQGGQIVWSAMKQDTDDAFGGDPKVHGGTAFLHHLRDAARGPDARTVLVGHSTGAVYICHFLRHADTILPPGVKFDVVLLAPACTAELLNRTLTQRADRIANLRIFTMQDELERSDRLLSLVYPRSLLYFVSGVVEDEPDMPIAGMQRFYSDHRFSAPEFAAVDGLRRFLDGADGRVVWSEADGVAGRATAARGHGDFDNDEATLESVAHIVRAGF